MGESERIVLTEILGGMGRMEIKGISIDSRTIKEGELFVALKGDRFDGHDFVVEAIGRGAWGAVVERSALETNFQNLSGLKNIIPVEDTLLALQEMGLMHRKKFSVPVIAVTGSNGKTTTKEMLACILKQKGPVLKNEGNLNNHIGVPLTLLKLNADHRSAVIEMGMSGVGEIEALARIASPDVGVITNIGPAHLEFLGSVDMVARAKAELLENLGAGDTAVLNADDPYFKKLKEKFNGHIVTFGIEKKADVAASEIRQEKDFTDFTLKAEGAAVQVRLRALGRHNVSNALAAAAAAIAVGMPVDSVKYGLDDFSPVTMRTELRQIHGRLVLADYYNANPVSTAAALETLMSLRAAKKAVAVLGDMLELGKAAPEAHREIGRTAMRLGVDIVITVGTLARFIREGAREAGMGEDSVFEAVTNSDAAALLRKCSHPGDAVLIKGSRGMKMEKILEEF